MKERDETATTRAPAGRGRGAIKSKTMRVEVVKAHDGIEKGEILVRTRATAEMMIAKGFYKEIQDD